ncbi:unnamed protein product [Rotaria sp. Silwood2]|nr:unnamed protein product [Rotaria sp. Silwood2]
MEADPDELLAWLKGDGSSERDLQMIALEQLCMLVLMSDNIDRCFEQYKPQLFLPALCDIFNDPLVPTHILEVTARALTYFLDVSVDCAKKITSHSTVIRSMCNCLQVVDIEDRTNKDLAEQIIKVFERLCLREASSIYEHDGLRYVIEFINNCYSVIHKDSLQSALNVVVKLIGKIDPQNSSTLDQTIESLSNLLLHDDPFVADNALRCFATLADRFSRKNVDPEPLMRYCLKDVLLRSLHHVSKTSTDATGTHSVSNVRGIITNLSVVTGLLSTLCRGSAKVTYDLLRSDLPDALESALCNGDERCVLDIMRFLDLLIGLLFEGRQTLVRSGNISRTTNPSIPTNESLQSSSSTSTTNTTPSDRSQQQIIEYIRSRDVQAFINYIEENNIDINYTDHVGQTMLNWVSAFGTREMVEYLCRHGADVNRGQRSSSLHYAACFGRPPIVRILLKYGANIDLRDEDGRTALDKARERQDDSHQEVIDILQSSHEWNDTKQSSINNSITEQTKDNIEIQLIYLERLLVIFCQLYQNTMILTIKRCTLHDQEDNEDINRNLSWIIIDLGLFIIPTHFTLRHPTGGFTNWTKNFLFQISKDTIHFLPCETSLVNDSNSPTATWIVKNLAENSTGFRYIRIHQKSSRHSVCISGFEVYGQVLSAVDIRSKTELTRSRSTRDDTRNRSTNSREKPSYSHSYSTSSASTRTSKMQSHILRRLASMSTSNTSNRSNDSTNDNRSEQSTLSQILIDLSSIPTDLSSVLESNDPERLRLAIEEALTHLTSDKTLNENTNLLNLISQRKSISTPDISNGEITFSVSTTEQASSADNLFPSSNVTDHVLDLMEGLSDQISQQHDVLVEKTQTQSKTSLGSSTLSECDLIPMHSDTTNTNSRLELEEFHDEILIVSKDEANNNSSTSQLTQSMSNNTTESIELLCAATEENNKKNATNECSEQRISLSENDTNSSVPNISSLNILTTSSTAINIADIPIIDDETIRIEESANLSDQQRKQTEETTTTDDEDDEQTLLKCLKLTSEQIEAPVEEDEDEDEDEEQQDEEEEEYNEELQEQLHGQQQEITHRNWDDDFVLKRQLSVLLPAFDGRPGRTNINATQDIPVPTTMAPKEETSTKRRSNADALTAANMTLYIRGPSPTITGLKDTDIEMDDPDATIFKYVQQLINPFPSSQRNERIKRIFEPTYTIIYTEKSHEQSKSNTTQLKDENIFNSSNDPQDICIIEDILKLLRQLYYLSTNYIQTNPHLNENFSIDNYFYSKKLNNKLLQQIQDSILIASSSLPSWTSWLIHSYKFLYPFETRQLYFRTTSFGTSRSIVWLQERREELVRTIRNTNHSRSRLLNENSLHDFRFGRLKIDRAVAIDRENILHDAMNLFHYHAKLKSKLEIQFLNEEGTGDGPTLEFYALISNDLQKYNLGLWWNHDDYEHHQTDYVRKLEGLFPAPYPQDHQQLNDVCNYFSLMGILFAKCLLDKYLIDMPLSISFFKLLCMTSISNDIWYDGILDLNDLIMIEPSRGKFYKNLFELIEKRNKILNDDNKTNEEKHIQCQLLKIENDLHEPVDMEHLCLTFVYSPPSDTYGYRSVELIPNGSHMDVTIDNVDQYLNLSLQFILRDGIRRQMNAFRNGFNQVFSLDHLQCFNPHELQLVLCGNQWPSWTLDDLLTYIEPSHGFTRESAGFTKFLNVMLALDGLERKSVVQFITGCSSLPPGGLANLRPRLSVARKVEADDNSYPSVNTCYHYLKLADYSSEEILKLRLMTACKEREEIILLENIIYSTDLNLIDQLTVNQTIFLSTILQYLKRIYSIENHYYIISLDVKILPHCGSALKTIISRVIEQICRNLTFVVQCYSQPERKLEFNTVHNTQHFTPTLCPQNWIKRVKINTNDQSDARQSMLNKLPLILSSLLFIWKTISINQTNSIWLVKNIKLVREKIIEFMSSLTKSNGVSFLRAVVLCWSERKQQQKSSIIQRDNVNEIQALIDILMNINNYTTNDIMYNMNTLIRNLSATNNKKKQNYIVWCLQFLLTYLEQQKNVSIDCWSILAIMFKDCLSPSMSSSVTFLIIRILSIYVKQSLFTIEKRDLKDLQDIIMKVLENCNTIVASSLEQTNWLRKNLQVRIAQFEPGTQQITLDSSNEIDRSLTSENNSLDFDDNSQSMNFSLMALTILAEHAVKLLDIVYNLTDEKDRIIGPYLQNLVNNVMPYVRIHALSNAPCYRSASTLLMNISQYSYTKKTWKKEVFEQLFDIGFFQVDLLALNSWKIIIGNMIKDEKPTSFRDVMNRINAVQTGLLVSKEQEYEQRSVLIKRFAFIIYATEKDQCNRYLPDILECIADLLKLPQVPIVYTQIFLLFRALLIRISNKNLISFWPILMAELIQILLQLEQDLLFDIEGDIKSNVQRMTTNDITLTNISNGTTDSNPSLKMYLYACKLLDTLLAMPYSELCQFQLFRSAFVVDHDIINSNSNIDIFIVF